MLETYKSLTGQAETKDTYEAYKELIETIRKMNYEELYNVMRDAATALKVLCRSEEKAKIAGLLALTDDIVKLGAAFLQLHDHPVPINAIVVPQWKEPYTGYTYEFIEKQKEAKEV